LLGSYLREPSGRWADIVGSSIAEESALVGLSPEGALRVMALNAAARDELVARADAVVSAYNTVVGQQTGSLAQRLVCWVNPEMSQRSQTKFGPRSQERPTQVDKAVDNPQRLEDRAQAIETVSHVADSAVRDALADLRTAALQRKRRLRIKGEST
jgi:hypothetical protein